MWSARENPRELLKSAWRREASAVPGMLREVTAHSPLRFMSADNTLTSRLDKELHAYIKDKLPLIKKWPISS